MRSCPGATFWFQSSGSRSMNFWMIWPSTCMESTVESSFQRRSQLDVTRFRKHKLTSSLKLLEPKRLHAVSVHGCVLVQCSQIQDQTDKHLDFRVSVLCSAGTTPRVCRQLTVSTVVHCHNLLRRSYINVVAPFHRLVIKASLRRAAQIG